MWRAPLGALSTMATAVIAALTAFSVAPPAFASPRVWEGDPMPMIFDAQGGRHYYAYGYCVCGPLVPAIGPQIKQPFLRTNAAISPSMPPCRGLRKCQSTRSRPNEQG